MNKEVLIDYTNWRGERRFRMIIPVSLTFTSKAPYHMEEQWLLDAWDVFTDDDGVVNYQPRTFAMNKIHEWVPSEG